MSVAGWTGRVDPDDGPSGFRWHQVVQLWSRGCLPGTAFVGLASDEGVRRNQGRMGAIEGPTALRAMLSNMPAEEGLALYDMGDVVCSSGRLEEAQEKYSERVAQLLQNGQFVIGLGGGHEIAWASASGLLRNESKGKLGILNLDAHFDLRRSKQATSGTSFRQILGHTESLGIHADYRVYGISEAANSQALFNTANELGVRWRTDDELTLSHLPDRLLELREWFDSLDTLYLTICLDVLPAWVAPGVSAPASRGVSIEVLEPIVKLASKSGKLRLADVAELCPRLDIDNRTARVAARLVWRIVHSRRKMEQV